MEIYMNRISYRGVQDKDRTHGFALVKKTITLHFLYTIRK